MMTLHTTDISSTSQRRRSPWLGAALLAGALAGGIPGRAGASSCAVGESLTMTDPVVTVIAGPGDVVAEQELWSSLEVSWLKGNFQVSFGKFGETFTYEAAP